LWAEQGRPPALHVLTAELGEPTVGELLEVLTADQRYRWETGRPVRAEEYLERFPLCRDEEAALQLIYSEFLLRRQLGDSPRVEEYLGRFPGLAGPLERQLMLEEMVRGMAGEGPRPASASRPLPERIGKYRVIDLLGDGGQAAVYRAIHPVLGQEVAIKL